MWMCLVNLTVVLGEIFWLWTFIVNFYIRYLLIIIYIYIIFVAIIHFFMSKYNEINK